MRNNEKWHSEWKITQLIFAILGRHKRLPLTFSPEVVWEQSGLDVGTTAGFLHENALHFMDNEAIEDAALVASYFSDVGV
jgi:hypothetical protein